MTAAFTGSFDPVTYGHLDLIERSQAILDKLVIVVVDNLEKNLLFSAKERLLMLKETTKQFSKVSVEYHSGLLANYLQEQKINVIIRGLRSVGDYEYELQVSLVNKTLFKNLETLFIPTDPKFMHISSSVARQVASCGGNVDNLVPSFVKHLLINKVLRVEE